MKTKSVIWTTLEFDADDRIGAEILGFMETLLISEYYNQFYSNFIQL